MVESGGRIGFDVDAAADGVLVGVVAQHGLALGAGDEGEELLRHFGIVGRLEHAAARDGDEAARIVGAEIEVLELVRALPVAALSPK